MAQAYLDQSGITFTSRFCIVAGYVASATEWRLFRIEWFRILKKFGVEQEFHAQRFWSKDPQGHGSAITRVGQIKEQMST
jgi:hypothetical protein